MWTACRNYRSNALSASSCLFVGLLVAFHWLNGPVATAITRAENGTGGGYIGALLQQGLVAALGDAGTAILVVAWLVIGLAMTLDLSLQEMFQWAGPLAARIKDAAGRLARTRQTARDGAGGPVGRAARTGRAAG